MQDRSDLLVGLIIGGLVGTLVGILMAPAPGEDTRRQVRQRAEGAANQLRETSARLSAQAGKSAQDFARRARNLDGANGVTGSVEDAAVAAEAAATGDAEPGTGEEA